MPTLRSRSPFVITEHVDSRNHARPRVRCSRCEDVIRDARATVVWLHGDGPREARVLCFPCAAHPDEQDGAWMPLGDALAYLLVNTGLRGLLRPDYRDHLSPAAQL
jgi:hypothetical protein